MTSLLAMSGVVGAAAGTLGYVVNGTSAADLPGCTLGYVYLPSLVVATRMLISLF